MRVTVDSNIYSALPFGGRPMALLRSDAARKITLFISEPILSETLRVLREKFAWPADKLEWAERIIAKMTVRVMPTQALTVIQEDSDDNRVLECAVASGSEAIVSGDNDLLRLGNYGNIRIMRVSDFLDQEESRVSRPGN